ncbi:ATP-dependent 6-phosphofructokinase [Candidatus Margulisiibacteriota bacterium]
MTIKINFKISSIGKPNIKSPLILSKILGDKIVNYVRDDQNILYNIETKKHISRIDIKDEEVFEKAGPREFIYFDPAKVHAGIVSSGGLCPGINDVIRALVLGLWNRYQVRQISGIRYGYKGFLPEYHLPIMELNPGIVDDIHNKGGSILGVSRGSLPLNKVVDAIERMNLNVLFTIGGDGSQKGALNIANEIERRGLKTAVVGIPKTIDNDLCFIQRSFGFQTAVEKAVEAVTCAHTEATSAINGIGLVKVMGRESGFIAAQTALALNDVDFVLVPEVPFDLGGKNGLFVHLEKKLSQIGHSVILVAEGAGQNLLNIKEQFDASGNKKLGNIGLFLKKKITDHFKKKEIEATLKYIDPSYIIRSAPANSNDSLYCARLGYQAVHAAMAGKTKLVISLVNNRYVHLPMEMVISKRNHIDTEGSLWRDVLEACHQPVRMSNDS